MKLFNWVTKRTVEADQAEQEIAVGSIWMHKTLAVEILEVKSGYVRYKIVQRGTSWVPRNLYAPGVICDETDVFLKLFTPYTETEQE